MIELDGDLLIGLGNEPAGSDGALIVRVAPDGSLAAEHVLDEQGIHDMHEHGGEIFVAGTDPTDDWMLGNIYVRDAGGVWAKRRTLPLTMHTWGLCHETGGDLFAAVGAHARGEHDAWEGRVMRSPDDGLTWTQNIQINNYRIYDVVEFGGRLYAVGYNWNEGYIAQLWVSVNHGLTWSLVSGVEPYRHNRMIVYGSNLVMVSNAMTQLVVIHLDHTLSISGLPCAIRYPILNGLAVVGSSLYVLDDAGYIWKTDDLVSWECYSQVPRAISIFPWPSQSCLVVSDCGVNARLWKVPIS